MYFPFFLNARHNNGPNPKWALQYFKNYALYAKVQYHYLALQTLLLRTWGRTTTYYWETLFIKFYISYRTIWKHCGYNDQLVFTLSSNGVLWPERHRSSLLKCVVVILHFFMKCLLLVVAKCLFGIQVNVPEVLAHRFSPFNISVQRNIVF